MSFGQRRIEDPFEEEGGGLEVIRQHAGSLWRYKWIILVAAVLGIGGAFVAWQRGQPVYQAQGNLWVRGSGMNALGPIESEGILPPQSWMDLLRSFNVLDPVVADQKLFVEPEDPQYTELFADFNVSDAPATGGYVLRIPEGGSEAVLLRGDAEVDRAPIGDSIGGDLGLLWEVPEELDPGEEVTFSVSTPRAAAIRLQNQLLSQMDPRGNFILLQLTGQDPQRVAAVLNGVMENHVQLAADLKRSTLDREYEILQEQLAVAERELGAAERALESFRVETITLPTEESRAIQPGLEMTQRPVLDEFFTLRVEEETLERDLERLREVAADMSEGSVPIETLQLIPSASGATQLQSALNELLTAEQEERALLERYTSDHPAVQEVAQRIRQLEEERIPSLLSQFIQQLEGEREVLNDRLAQSEADLSQIPPRAIEEARLRRRVELAANFYTEIRSRYEIAELTRASSQPEVQILDRAVPPESPSSDPRQNMAMAVFSIFLGLGLAGALVVGHFDSKLRTPDEVQSAFGLTVLGAIPRIHGSGMRRRESSAMKNLGQVREAFRELRTNLTYAYGAAGPLVVTVSSPSMEEGKTTISSNLAISFAETGQRVLIIDADTRRGDLHHFLGGLRKPGLTDYLRSTASGDEILQETEHENLDVIASGTHVSNSPELLSSSEMGRMLAALKQRYDVIIVDSPPLGAGADALVLSSITSHMLLVIRSGATERGFTESKLDPLSRLPVRLLGVVLNDYQPSRLEGDRYKYYGSYLPGYEAHEEEAESPHGSGDRDAAEGEDANRRLTAGVGPSGKDGGGAGARF